MNPPTLATITDALGWTLIHFLWQASAIALACAALCAIFRRGRYAIATLALTSMLACAAVTLVSELNTTAAATPEATAPAGSPAAAPAIAPIPTPNSETPTTPVTATAAAAEEAPPIPWLPKVVAVWALGVAFFSVRFLLGWRGVQRLRANATPITDHPIATRFGQLRAQLKISAPVRLLSSATAAVPMVIGAFRPAVIIPARLLSGFDARQLEAIVAHELAHVRRHDFLVNLLQNVIEALFFYHPAVWWVSARMRQEREHRCDDIAAKLSGGNLAYGHALAALEQALGGTAPTAAVAASGGSLLKRIRRLADQSERQANAWPALLLCAATVAVVASALVMNATADEENDDPIEETEDPPEKEKPERGPIKVTGTVVDDATGEPVTDFIIQAGKRDPGGPGEISWGYSETRGGGEDGKFSTSIRWFEEWTARIVADGYQPMPILTKTPADGAREVEVELRLKTGGSARGQVLDHEGKPLAGASVFRARPTGLNLHGGKAWQSFGDAEIDKTAKPATTGEDGKFKLSTGDTDRLFISHPTLDAWPVVLPEDLDKEMVIRLPQAASLTVEYDIEGAPEDETIFFQTLLHTDKKWKFVECLGQVPVKNGGKVTLSGLVPGPYQFARNHLVNLDGMGINAFVTRTFLEFKPGEHKVLKLVRDKGTPIVGNVAIPDDVKLYGTVVKVQAIEKTKDPSGNENTYDLAAVAVKEDGTYETELIPPGKYRLIAEAYKRPEPSAFSRTGGMGPHLRAEIEITIPRSGAPTPRAGPEARAPQVANATARRARPLG